MCVEANKLYRWYKEVLSDYRKLQSKGELNKHDLVLKDKGGSTKTICTPILKPENFGQCMAIDEKKIGEEFFTVFTNKETGKIAMLTETMRSEELMQVVRNVINERYGVKVVTRDLSNSYDWFCRQAFPNAMQVADKYHIIKHLLDSVQDLRVYYRQQQLSKRRQAYEAFKQKEIVRKQACRAEGKTFKAGEFQYRENRLENRETPLELLARSRYLLYKFEHQWTPSQLSRANVLFALYPKLKIAWQISCQFRIWYRKEHIGRDRQRQQNQLHQWYKQVKEADIEELLNFKSMVERHEGIILNYFLEGNTNAIAEQINRKIKQFIQTNQGTRDREFFFFRLSNYYS